MLYDDRYGLGMVAIVWYESCFEISGFLWKVLKKFTYYDKN